MCKETINMQACKYVSEINAYKKETTMVSKSETT